MYKLDVLFKGYKRIFVANFDVVIEECYELKVNFNLSCRVRVYKKLFWRRYQVPTILVVVHV